MISNNIMKRSIAAALQVTSLSIARPIRGINLSGEKPSTEFFSTIIEIPFCNFVSFCTLLLVHSWIPV